MTYQVKPHQGRSTETRQLQGWQRLAVHLGVSTLPVNAAMKQWITETILTEQMPSHASFIQVKTLDLCTVLASFDLPRINSFDNDCSRETSIVKIVKSACYLAETL